MANEVAKSGSNAIAAAQALRGSIAAVKAAIPERGNVQFLTLDKGAWLMGQDKREVNGAVIALNPMSIKSGFICWTDYPKEDRKKNEVMGEMMVPLGQPVPLKLDLPDRGWPWKEQIAIEGRILEGKDKGTTVSYSTTSVGGLSAMRALMDQIELQIDEDPEYIAPVVTLDTDHYPHKVHGRVYIPVFEIGEWMSMAGVLAEAGEAAETDDREATSAPDEEEEPAKPARRARAAVEKEPATPARRAREAVEKDDREAASAPDGEAEPAGADEEPAPRRRRRR